MATRTINVNQLPDNCMFYVRGKITFCRITSQIAGDELARRNQANMKNGWNVIDRPHTTVSLCDAQVLFPNPNQPTIQDTYANESLFTSQKHPERHMCYTAYNKGNNLPKVGILQPDNSVVETPITKELANGLDVTLCMRVFPTRQRNKGVSLDCVIVNEPIRFYEGSGFQSSLEQAGLRWKPAANTGNAPASVDATATATTPGQGLPFGQPVPKPEAGTNYFTTQGGNQTTANTQVQPPAPAPTGFGNVAGGTQPALYGQNTNSAFTGMNQPVNSGNASGVGYDPATDRNY